MLLGRPYVVSVMVTLIEDALIGRLIRKWRIIESSYSQEFAVNALPRQIYVYRNPNQPNLSILPLHENTYKTSNVTFQSKLFESYWHLIKSSLQFSQRRILL